MKITAAVVGERHGEFELREVFLDEPRDGEVLVRIVAAGICHTDSITRRGDLCRWRRTAGRARAGTRAGRPR
ncbi:Alcohol dehydrogenase GroES-like domain [Lentzea californiensis]|nr:Alcohol dehydrogenase GroES-like domain [Lentzea californiensis]